jgi:hypothetical protein
MLECLKLSTSPGMGFSMSADPDRAQRVGDTSDVMHHHVSLYRLYRCIALVSNGASGGTGKYTSNIRCIERYINPVLGNLIPNRANYDV